MTCPKCLRGHINQHSPRFCLDCGWAERPTDVLPPGNVEGGPPGHEHFPEMFNNTGDVEAHEDLMHAICGMDDAGDRD